MLQFRDCLDAHVAMCLVTAESIWAGSFLCFSFLLLGSGGRELHDMQHGLAGGLAVGGSSRASLGPCADAADGQGHAESRKYSSTPVSISPHAKHLLKQVVHFPKGRS